MILRYLIMDSRPWKRVRKVNVDASWPWDQFMCAITTDPLYKVSSTSAEKKAAWQKVMTHFSGFVFTNIGPVLHSTPMARRPKSRRKERPGWRNSDPPSGIYVKGTRVFITTRHFLPPISSLPSIPSGNGPKSSLGGCWYSRNASPSWNNGKRFVSPPSGSLSRDATHFLCRFSFRSKRV